MPTGSVTCVGSTLSGQTLVYDGERRLAHWQSGPGTIPATETDTLYDGEGQRVKVQLRAQTCTPTCGETLQSETLYLAGGVEELSTAEPSGTTTTTT